MQPRRSMLDALQDQQAASGTSGLPHSGNPEVRESGSASDSAQVTGDSRTSGLPDSGSPDVPRYLQMERKDLRLRPDQCAELEAIRRRISKQRTNRGERITDSTVVRLAIDLLRAHTKNLQGETEDELRASIGGLPPNIRRN